MSLSNSEVVVDYSTIAKFFPLLIVPSGIKELYNNKIVSHMGKG